MAERHHLVREDGSILEIVWTNTEDGDFHIDGDPGALARRRQLVMDGEWATVRQVHGNRVVDANDVLGSATLPEADGIVTSLPGQPIAVQGADCAPIAFVTNRGPIGVAHAGWRGLAAGIVRSVVDELHERDAIVDRAIIGPVICADCYEFGAEDLDHVAQRLGDGVRSTSATGSPALDMAAGLVAAFDAVDVTDVSFVGGCPACGDTGFSHRARKDPARHCLVARVLVGEGVASKSNNGSASNE